MTITVIGVEGDGEFSDQARLALSRAELVVGGRRQLALANALIRPAATRVELGPLRAGLAKLGACSGPAVVLASGDPGWFGITRALATLGRPLRVLPAPTALSRLAAAVGRPWDDVVTRSGHGRDPSEAVNAARALPAVAVLTSPAFTVPDLARALDGWPRLLTVGERLGYPEERVTTCPASDAAGRTWAEPNLVLVTDPTRPGPSGHDSPRWASAESAFLHRDGMITKAEVRAVAIANLRPAIGRLVWDIGAGSGAVGIECATFGAAVVAVDRDAAAGERVRRNAQRFSVSVRVVEGSAPEALAGLPEPDAAFVGGGGPAVVAAVAARGVPRVVVSCAAIDHALSARDSLRAGGYAVEGVQLAASRLADLPAGATRLVALNPVTLLCATREGGRS